MKARILVFCRAPVPGEAKTRLIPALGADGAARLQAELVPDTVQRAVAAGVGPVELWAAGDDSTGLLAKVAADHAVVRRTQSGRDLGERMHAALAAGDGGPAIVIGTDCPALMPAVIAAAAAALARNDAVVVPALDGGYVLLGMHDPPAALFDGIPWGTETVLQATRERLLALGWRWHELPALPDVDVPADLDRLATLSPAWRSRVAALREGS